MTPTSKPIVFFGTEDFSAQFLEAIIDSGYDVRMVVTKPDAKKGRGHKLSPPVVKTLAQAHSIPVQQPQQLRDIHDTLASIGKNAAGILVSYGKIIPQTIIDLFDAGIINVHPSLLPRYRGPSPIESAILNGDGETGVSIMQLSREMDAGPVYSQARMSLSGSETRAGLYQALGTIGVHELLQVLPAILDGSLTPAPQNEDEAVYCRLLSKADSPIDPQRLTALEAERHVRAYQGFPKSTLLFNDTPLVITQAHVSSEQRTPLDIRCNDGQFLSIDELTPAGGRNMTAAAFLHGRHE